MNLDEDEVKAAAHLADRCGAKEFEIGYTNHEATRVEDAQWYAHVTFKGARLIADNHRSPSDAANALAHRILAGAMCRCLQPVTLSDSVPGCRWRRVGPQWTPGCDVPPIPVNAQRGDHAAITQAMNRAQRRKAARKR